MVEKKRRPPKTVPDITQKSWDRARVPIYDFLRSLWEGYSGQPAPHATTHKGGSDDISGTASPIPIEAGVAGDPGDPTAGFAPIDHTHAVLTAPAVALGESNQEGTSSALARADHVHDASDLLYLALVQ